MPSSTFHKLSDSKRKDFLSEAYKEFALNSLEAASITNLVKSLGIAKGSVYQYFDDKDDLYSYLVLDAYKQLNQILDKACPYNGEIFFDWYTKLVMVEVKFYMSFPHIALLFQRLSVESGASQKKLAEEIQQGRLSRITAALPARLYNSPINNRLLLSSSLLIFDLITAQLDLENLILEDDVVFLETKELVSICSEWVLKLKEGL